jgi:23S rRNA (guanosine2251-2'-O)-methyltransferase
VASRELHASGRGPPPRPQGAEEALIFGIHAAAAALANPARAIRGIYLTDNAERQLHQILAKRSLTHVRVSPRDLDRRLGANTVHQGALLETEVLPDATLTELMSAGAYRPILVLDQVTDPHNVGAILRSAAAFGTTGLVMTRRHSPVLAGALAKSASGALEHVAVTRVANLARALEQLKARCMVIGLDADGAQAIEEFRWPEHAALVLGAEGKGLRHLTRQSCDQLCRITMQGPLASLNVSNAAAIALHLASVHRRAHRVKAAT